MDKNYYLEYYTLERTHWWFIIRGKIILQSLKKHLCGKKNIKILNIGAATGRTTEILSEIGEVTSIEYEKECCEFVKEKTGLSVINGSILELPFENDSFDLVCAFDVIEHVQDDVKAAAEMERVCKKDGLVAITVPAFEILWSKHDEVNHHFRRYRRSSLLKILKSTKVTYSTYFNSFLFLPILLFRLTSKIFPQAINRKGAGSDFTVSQSTSITNKILGKIFGIEIPLLRYLKFPFGVSIFLISKK